MGSTSAVVRFRDFQSIKLDFVPTILSPLPPVQSKTNRSPTRRRLQELRRRRARRIRIIAKQNASRLALGILEQVRPNNW